MDANTIIIFVFKVVGLAMGIVSIVLGFFPKEASPIPRRVVWVSG